MSYTLEDGLSPRPKIVELADYWEIECLRKANHSVSILNILKSTGIADDVQEQQMNEHDFELEEQQIRVIEEIDRRVRSCADKYPFRFKPSAYYTLELNRELAGEYLWIYVYLLLATRNNMSANKTVNQIDGTEIFEKLSKDTLMNYLGANSKGINFGTAAEGGFYVRLQQLVNALSEGRLHSVNNEISYNPQDDKLDVAAWIPFNDNLPSKLICFGQCKTGTHWHDLVNQLKVSSFLKKWFSHHPAVNPIETFMIADILPIENFEHRASNNLFFDRFRVANLSHIKEGNDWFEDLKTWTDGVMRQYSFSFPQAKS